MSEHPVTQAVRALRSHGISFVPRRYDYVEHGGTARSSEELGVDEYAVIKTIVLETDTGKPLLVLMHGTMQVSTKRLARHLGVRSIAPCAPERAEKWTGYVFGGTSPFGTRHPIPIYAEASIFDLPRILINGGKRGFLVEIDPAVLRTVLAAEPVSVATPKP